MQQDGTAVVFGAEPIGIAVWFALRAFEVRDVAVVEPAPARRTVMEALGANVLNPAEVDVVDAIMQRTDGRDADAACDAAGVWVTETQRTLCNVLILVDQSAEPIASSDVVGCGWGGARDGP